MDNRMFQSPFRQILFFLFLLLSFGGFSNEYERLQFESIYLDEGLDFPNIRETVQDAEGYIWFGSGGGGLYRYDGAGMNKFSHNPNDEKTISSNMVTSFLVDAKKRLWIGTTSGLNLYDPYIENFTRYYPNHNHPLGYNQNVIHEIIQDSDGDIWIGTAGGISKMFEDSDTIGFEHLFISAPQNDSSLYSVRAIGEYAPGYLLIGTEHGLFWYNKKQNKFQLIDYEFTKNSFIYTFLIDHLGYGLVGTSNGLYRFSVDQLPKLTQVEAYYNSQMSNVVGRFTDNRINNLQIAKNGVLWVGSVNGLNLLYLPDLTGIPKAYNASYTASPCDPHSLTNNNINDIYIDREGTAWIGTTEGVSKNITRKYWFLTYPASVPDKNPIGQIEARSIIEDKQGNIWIANYNHGITIFQKDKNKYIQFPQDIFRCLTFYCVLPDDDNIAWLAAYDDEVGGLYQMILPHDFFTTLDFDAIKFRHFQDAEKNRKPGNINYGKWVFKDSKDRIWFLTREGGACKFDFKGDPLHAEPEIEQYWQQNGTQHGMYANNTSHIIEDHTGKIWLSTRGNGFGKYIDETNRFEWYSTTQGENHPNHNGLFCLHEDPQGYIWIGTNGGGVNRFDPATKQFMYFTENEGLNSNAIISIINDKHGNIWASSPDGISVIHPDLKTIQNFDLYDGLKGSYNARVALRTQKGEILFGGNKGLVEVYKNSSLIKDTIKPNIVFTKLSIKGQDIQPSNHEQNFLNLSINKTEKLTLTHRDFPFSIMFTLLSYTNPRKNQYTYMLQGLDDDWIDINAAYPQVSFNYLKGGDYILRIKGCNPENVWSDIKELKIKVKPPFYMTFWFLGLIIFIIGLVFASAIIFRIRFFREQTQQLNRLVDEKTSELQLANKQILNQNETLAKQRDELMSSNATKDKLFSIIAHDLRGPFGNVMNLSEMLSEQIESDLPRKKQHELAYYIYKGTLEVDTLLGNLMEWSRSQSKKLKYTPSEVILEDIIQFVFDLFSLTAKEKDNTLSYNISGKPMAIADADMLTSIIRNLVNNSLKYTDHGNVKINCINTDELYLEVIDTGIGMPPEVQQHIFDIADKKTSRGTMGEKGTGLGLLLVKEFVEFHNGTVYIESKETGGTKVKIHIPQKI